MTSTLRLALELGMSKTFQINHRSQCSSLVTRVEKESNDEKNIYIYTRGMFDRVTPHARGVCSIRSIRFDQVRRFEPWDRDRERRERKARGNKARAMRVQRFIF